MSPFHTVTFLVSMSQWTWLCFVLMCKCLPYCALLTQWLKLWGKISSFLQTWDQRIAQPWCQSVHCTYQPLKSGESLTKWRLFDHLNKCWDGVELSSFRNVQLLPNPYLSLFLLNSKNCTCIMPQVSKHFSVLVAALIPACSRAGVLLVMSCPTSLQAVLLLGLSTISSLTKTHHHHLMLLSRSSVFAYFLGYIIPSIVFGFSFPLP